MSKKRVLAIIGLIFMAVFSVTFVIWLAAPKFHGGVFGYTALFSGACGLTFLCIIKVFFKTKNASNAGTNYLPTPEKQEVDTENQIPADSEDAPAPNVNDASAQSDQHTDKG